MIVHNLDIIRATFARLFGARRVRWNREFACPLNYEPRPLPPKPRESNAPDVLRDFSISLIVLSVIIWPVTLISDFVARWAILISLVSLILGVTFAMLGRALRR